MQQIEIIKMCILACGLAVLGVEDIKEQQLHSLPLLLLGITGAVVAVVGKEWTNAAFLWRFLPGILLLFLAWMTKESIGYGDGLVVLCTGCFYTVAEIFGLLFLAVTFAGLVALGLLAVVRRGRKTRIPFVPFLFGAHLAVWALRG